ncbi:MAG: PEP-CTERM sorting domain-containing protein [Verrucomicrobia bacterium]|nr:PEP-CTERM sorting domain-containing protein [Verrucomicrobiota bacterium]
MKLNAVSKFRWLASLLFWVPLFSPQSITAQIVGALNFASRIAGVYDAPVFVCEGGVLGRASGTNYLVQLFAGIDATHLVPVGGAIPFRTQAFAGYWRAAAISIDRSLVGPTNITTVQIRAWQSTAGDTYDVALANGGLVGQSNIIRVQPIDAPDPPSTLTGLQSFTIGAAECPEPSTWALLLVGLGVLLCKRQRK